MENERFFNVQLRRFVRLITALFYVSLPLCFTRPVNVCNILHRFSVRCRQKLTKAYHLFNLLRQGKKMLDFHIELWRLSQCRKDKINVYLAYVHIRTNTWDYSVYYFHF